MLLSRLTADELERLAYINPEYPGVHQAHAARCQEALYEMAGDSAYYETENAELTSKVDDLEKELDDLAHKNEEQAREIDQLKEQLFEATGGGLV